MGLRTGYRAAERGLGIRRSVQTIVRRVAIRQAVAASRYGFRQSREGLAVEGRMHQAPCSPGLPPGGERPCRTAATPNPEGALAFVIGDRRKSAGPSRGRPPIEWQTLSRSIPSICLCPSPGSGEDA